MLLLAITQPYSQSSFVLNDLIPLNTQHGKCILVMVNLGSHGAFLGVDFEANDDTRGAIRHLSHELEHGDPYCGPKIRVTHAFKFFSRTIMIALIIDKVYSTGTRRYIKMKD